MPTRGCRWRIFCSVRNRAYFWFQSQRGWKLRIGISLIGRYWGWFVWHCLRMWPITWQKRDTMGLMQALAEMYEKSSVNNKVYLMKKLFNLKMSESGQVVEHLNSFNIVVNQLVSVGIKCYDEICALILLASLSNSWEHVMAAITNSIGNATLRFIDIRNAILAKEVWRKDSGEASISNSALNVDNRGRSSERNKGNGNWGKSKNGRGKSRNSRNLRVLELW